MRLKDDSEMNVHIHITHQFAVLSVVTQKASVLIITVNASDIMILGCVFSLSCRTLTISANSTVTTIVLYADEITWLILT
jgi:hypothetical protein